MKEIDYDQFFEEVLANQSNIQESINKAFCLEDSFEWLNTIPPEIHEKVKELWKTNARLYNIIDELIREVEKGKK